MMITKPRIDILCQTINGWYIAEQVGVNAHGVALYKCRCTVCGYETTKTSGDVRYRKLERCSQCPPQYNFEYKGAFAIGTLPCGTRFLVDTDMIERIKNIFWHKNSHGYIVFTKPKQPAVYLHRTILGVGGNIVVDHINRDKTDNRCENLRIVNPAQNASNKGMQPYNTTGYVGVSYLKHCDKYQARIGKFNRSLTLGMFNTIEQAAAAHDIATLYLNGEFHGHLNNVYEPSVEFIQRIENKCERFAIKYGGEEYGKRRNIAWQQAGQHK